MTRLVPHSSSTSSATTKSVEQSTAQKLLHNPTFHVIFAVVLGLLCGFVFQSLGWNKEEVLAIFGLPGQLWLKALKCIVLPMVTFAMVQAMVMLRSLPDARTVGAGVVCLYALTTLLAATVGCLVAVIVLGPLMSASGGSVEGIEESGEVPELTKLSLLDSVLALFKGLVPGNLIGDAVENKFLPVIIASIVFGLLVEDKEEDGSESITLRFVAQLNNVVSKIIAFLMRLAPVGICSLVFKSAAGMDLADTGRLVGIFVASCYVAFAFHALVMYPLIIACLAHRNPVIYLYKILPAVLTALGTSSSIATLPMNTRCAIEGNNIRPYVAKFVLSLGATVNMDGTGLFLICAVFFLGRIEGVTFTIGRFMLMSVLAMLCSLGSAPVPSAGMVLLVTMLHSSGVPVRSSFGLVVGIVWIVDRGMTMVNITGDATVAAVVDRFFGERLAKMKELESSDADSAELGEAPERDG